MSDTLTDVAEDRTLRHWTFRGPARVKIGSEAHRQMFCRMLPETYIPSKPAVLEWPPLPPDALERLCSLPIWDIARPKAARRLPSIPMPRNCAIPCCAKPSLLLYINWVAWYRRTMPLWRRPWHSLRVAAIRVVLVWQRFAIARGIDAQGTAHDSNFLLANSGVIGEAMNARDLFTLCLAENDRRMSGYDARLLRPVLVPTQPRFALRFMKPSRRDTPSGQGDAGHDMDRR